VVNPWSSGELALPDDATVRLVVGVPGGLALGSDMGASLLLGPPWRAEVVPFPPGSRRSRVEAMAWHAGTLHLATTEVRFAWDLHGEVRSQRLPSDGHDGRDDVRSMLSVGERLLVGSRCRFEGGAGPPDAIALAADPSGRALAGTLDGRLWAIDGGEIRRFESRGKARPLRHVAWALGAWWIAAGGALWRWDGGSAWDPTPGEPTALLGTRDALWAVREGRVDVYDGRAWRPAGVAVARPWCLAEAHGHVWIGHVGGVAAVEPDARLSR
jgi:hypothetical protein